MAKLWKKIGMAIVIIACIVNVTNKLSTKVAFSDELKTSAKYMNNINQNITEQTNTIEQNTVNNANNTTNTGTTASSIAANLIKNNIPNAENVISN